MDQSSPIFLSNVEGVVVDKILFGFAMYGSFPEIFAIVVRNRAEFWTFFSPSQILGVGLPKVIPILSPLPYGTSPGKSFVRILPLTPKFYLLIPGGLISVTSFATYETPKLGTVTPSARPDKRCLWRDQALVEKRTDRNYVAGL